MPRAPFFPFSIDFYDFGRSRRDGHRLASITGNPESFLNSLLLKDIFEDINKCRIKRIWDENGNKTNHITDEDDVGDGYDGEPPWYEDIVLLLKGTNTINVIRIIIGSLMHISCMTASMFSISSVKWMRLLDMCYDMPCVGHACTYMNIGKYSQKVIQTEKMNSISKIARDRQSILHCQLGLSVCVRVCACSNNIFQFLPKLIHRLQFGVVVLLCTSALTSNVTKTI